MLEPLDPLLHSQLRLAIMSILISHESADFVYIKNTTGATAGNISIQLDKLEKVGYIKITKSFLNKRPHTNCKITAKGMTAFEKYVTMIKNYLHQ